MPGAVREHAVQFYEDDAVLVESLTRFGGAGIEAGDNVVLIARAETLARFREALSTEAIDLDRVFRSRQLTFLDADETLDRLMDGDMPDVGRFLDVIGGTLFDTTHARPRRFLRAYGEMVDVLWRRQNRRAAIALEGLWNELAHEHAFSLLCGYDQKTFGGGDPLDFDAVCWAHTRTIPSDFGSSDRIRPRVGTSS